MNYMSTNTLLIWLLIACAGTICNAKSTGNSTNPDTLRSVAPRSVTMTEAGARLALQYKNRYETAVLVIDQKDHIISLQATTFQKMDSTVTRLNRDGQGTRNKLTNCQHALQQTRRQLRGARLVNLGLIGAGLFYIGVRVGLF